MLIWRYVLETDVSIGDSSLISLKMTVRDESSSSEHVSPLYPVVELLNKGGESKTILSP